MGKGEGMKNILLIMTLLIIVIIAFSGCLEEWGGILYLQITDIPGDLNITKALVTISSVEVYSSAAGSDEDEKTESSTGWYTIVEEPQTFDLIALIDTKEFLGRGYLDTGRYNQIRLYVDKALVTINGNTYKLEIPSQTVKLIKPFKIENRRTTTLTLDFDIQKSVKSAGKDKYILEPTIKVIQE